MVPRKSYNSELVIESQNLEVLFLVLTFHLSLERLPQTLLAFLITVFLFLGGLLFVSPDFFFSVKAFII